MCDEALSWRKISLYFGLFARRARCNLISYWSSYRSYRALATMFLHVVWRLSNSRSVNSYGTHFSAFWISSMACNRLLMAGRDTFSSVPIICCDMACSSASSNYHIAPGHGSSSTEKLPLLKRQIHASTVRMLGE